MHSEEVFLKIKFEQLREDVPEGVKADVFWDNVPLRDGDYIITTRVEGV